MSLAASLAHPTHSLCSGWKNGASPNSRHLASVGMSCPDVTNVWTTLPAVPPAAAADCDCRRASRETPEMREEKGWGGEKKETSFSNRKIGSCCCDSQPVRWSRL